MNHNVQSVSRTSRGGVEILHFWERASFTAVSSRRKKSASVSKRHPLIARMPPSSRSAPAPPTSPHRRSTSGHSSSRSARSLLVPSRVWRSRRSASPYQCGSSAPRCSAWRRARSEPGRAGGRRASGEESRPAEAHWCARARPKSSGCVCARATKSWRTRHGRVSLTVSQCLARAFS